VAYRARPLLGKLRGFQARRYFLAADRLSFVDCENVMLDSERLPLTGATGQLGSLIVRRLEKQGRSPRLLARNPEKLSGFASSRESPRRLCFFGNTAYAGDSSRSCAGRDATNQCVTLDW
jgi:hypothetical protein